MGSRNTLRGRRRGRRRSTRAAAVLGAALVSTYPGTLTAAFAAEAYALLPTTRSAFPPPAAPPSPPSDAAAPPPPKEPLAVAGRLIARPLPLPRVARRHTPGRTATVLVKVRTLKPRPAVSMVRGVRVAVKPIAAGSGGANGARLATSAPVKPKAAAPRAPVPAALRSPQPTARPAATPPLASQPPEPPSAPTVVVCRPASTSGGELPEASISGHTEPLLAREPASAPPGTARPPDAPVEVATAPQAAASTAVLPTATAGATLSFARPAAFTSEDHPPPGRTRALKVKRVEALPLVDGSLDEPFWAEAPAAKGFYISERRRWPQEPTEVRVVSSGKALHFAFICWDSKPESIFSQQLKRDGAMGVDDHVTVQLDPYHNHRQISDFSVNSRGTQSDARAGGRARKIEWKGDWQAAVQRFPGGWTAEMAIPFSILEMQGNNRTFGVNFVRFHHRAQESSRWADLTPQFLPEENGQLEEIEIPRGARKGNLTVMHYGVAGRNTLSKTGTLRHWMGTTGADIRYTLANNLTSVLSLNPDFSQVEDQILDLGFDYNERFRVDNRPFFQEGSAFFGDRTYFYSGRVPNFDFGLKSFGKAGPFQLGVLGLQAPEGRRDYVLRGLRELGPTGGAAFTLIGSDRPEYANNLAVFEVNNRFQRKWFLDGDLAYSLTGGGFGNGMRGALKAEYQSPYWQAGVGVQRTDDRFFPSNGFIQDDLLGTQGIAPYFSFSRDYGAGPFFNLNGSISYSARDTLSGLLQHRQFSVYGGGLFRSNIGFNVGTTFGPYRPRAAGIGEWSSAVNDDTFYSATAYYSPQHGRFGGALTYSWGSLAGGPYSDILPSVWLRPTRRTYLSYSWERVYSFGASVQSILGATWEITPERSLSVRWVNLRDSWIEDSYLRIAFRQQVRRGLDIFAVYNNDPYVPSRFTIKLVKTFGGQSGGSEPPGKTKPKRKPDAAGPDAGSADKPATDAPPVQD